MPTWFLAPIARLKLPLLQSSVALTYRPIAGGAALGLRSAGRGDAGVALHLRDGLLSHDGRSQAVVDGPGLEVGRGRRGHPVGTP